NLAAEYVRGGLTSVERAAIDEHAESCSSCRTFLSQLLGTVGSSPTPRADYPTAEASQPSAPLEAAPFPILPRGAVVDRYLVLDRIGMGGMGVVYSAFDPQLDRKVALKLLRNLGANDSSRQRLQREARALARLSHPNVVVVHDIGTWEGQVFIAM